MLRGCAQDTRERVTGRAAVVTSSDRRGAGRWERTVFDDTVEGGRHAGCLERSRGTLGPSIEADIRVGRDAFYESRRPVDVSDTHDEVVAGGVDEDPFPCVVMEH